MPILLALAAFILAPGLSRTSSSVLLGVVQSHALTARALSAPRKRRYHRLARVYPLVLCGRTARPRRQTQASRSVLSTQLQLLSASLGLVLLDADNPAKPDSFFSNSKPLVRILASSHISKADGCPFVDAYNAHLELFLYSLSSTRVPILSLTS